MDYCEYLWIIFYAKQGLIYLKLNQYDVCLFYVLFCFFPREMFWAKQDMDILFKCYLWAFLSPAAKVKCTTNLFISHLRELVRFFSFFLFSFCFVQFAVCKI